MMRLVARSLADFEAGVGRDAGVRPSRSPGSVSIGAETTKKGGVDKNIGRDFKGVGGGKIGAPVASIELGFGKDLAQVRGQMGFGREIFGGEETETSTRYAGGFDREPQERNGMRHAIRGMVASNERARKTGRNL